MDTSKSSLDEAFLSWASYIEESSDLEGAVADPGKGIAMTVERAEINMPVELDVVVHEDGHVELGAIPPLYYVETSVMPVYHQVTLTLEIFQGVQHE